MYRGVDLVAEAARKNEYFITWGYICDHIKKDYGLSRNSNKRLSMYEVEKMLDNIWSDFYEAVTERILEMEEQKE